MNTFVRIAFKGFVGRYFSVASHAIVLDEAVVNEARRHDLGKQVEKYQRSISLGHRVIVIAHSQGNLFTNEAYKKLDDWMLPYFKVMGVATPSHRVPGIGPYVTFDNDPILYVPHTLGSNDENPVRYYNWIAGPDVNVDTTATRPCINIKLPIGETPRCNDTNWIAMDTKNSDFHAFDYYMSTAITKDKIYTHLTMWIRGHKTASSQWKRLAELGCGCNQRMKLTHEYSPETMDQLVKNVKPLVFNESGKLYQAYDETNATFWIKGDPNGTAIVKETNLSDVCYSLSGTEERIIGAENPAPHDGLLRVVLEWDKRDIDLNLNISGPTAGVKEEHPEYECPRENWYIEDDSGLVEGDYFVSVRGPSSVDEALMPEQIRVGVKAIGKGDAISVDINDSTMLSLGEVYRIHIDFRNMECPLQVYML